MADARRRKPGRLSRKRATIRLVGLAVAGVLVAAACSPPPTSGAGTVVDSCPLDALEDAQGRVEVDMWYGGIGGAQGEVMRDMVQRFNEGQDQILLTATNQGGSFQEVYRKYQSAASASPDDLPDILMAEDNTLQAMVDSGHVLPAQVCMDAEDYDLTQSIVPVIRQNYTVNGAFYPGFALPSSQILYYNKAHFAAAGLDPNDPPDTLQELYDTARTLKEQGVSDRPLSLKISWSQLKNWLTARGVDMVNEGNGREGLATEATFDTPEARAIVELLVRMQDEGLLNPFGNIEGSIDHYVALASQQSSMLIETSGAAANITRFLAGDLSAEQAGAEYDASDLDLGGLVPGTGQFPGVEAAGRASPGGAVFYMLSTAPPAEQAGSWRFLQFMLEPENGQRWFTEGGYLPIVSSVHEDEQVQAFTQQDLTGLLLAPALEQMVVADPDTPDPLIGPSEDFTNEIEDGIDRVLFDEADVGPSLQAAQTGVTEALERYAG